MTRIDVLGASEGHERGFNTWMDTQMMETTTYCFQTRGRRYPTVRTKFVGDATAVMKRLVARTPDNLSEDTTYGLVMALFVRAATL